MHAIGSNDSKYIYNKLILLDSLHGSNCANFYNIWWWNPKENVKGTVILISTS